MLILTILLFGLGKMTDLGVAHSTRTALAGSVTAFAGIAAAAELFVCSYLYTTSNERLLRILNAGDNPQIMARNWIAILLGTIAAAIASILALTLSDIFPTMSLAVMLGAAALTTCGLLRAIYWLHFALIQDRLNTKMKIIDPPPRIPTKPLRQPRPRT